MSADSRNSSVSAFLKDVIETSLNSDINFKLDKGLISDIDNVVFCKAKGFRGVVLTALVAKNFAPSFNPSTNFYACNPRSIFEKAIRPVLYEYKIPCGKSDPLNVAKNSNVLDKSWASGKRPEHAALSTVNLVSYISKLSPSNKNFSRFLLFFVSRLISLRDSITSLPISSFSPNEIPISIAHRLAKFLLDVPESGTVPQFFFATLLKEFRSFQGSHFTVHGGDESVFGTNTTSKKPGDIWETDRSNNISTIYEITVKSIDSNRLQDAVHSLNSLGISNIPVCFVCNFPSDIMSLNLNEPFLVFEGHLFQFFDIYSSFINLFIFLPEESQNSILNTIFRFISEFDRPLSTKEKWNLIFD